MKEDKGKKSNRKRCIISIVLLVISLCLFITYIMTASYWAYIASEVAVIALGIGLLILESKGQHRGSKFFKQFLFILLLIIASIPFKWISLGNANRLMHIEPGTFQESILYLLPILLVYLLEMKQL